MRSGSLWRHSAQPLIPRNATSRVVQELRTNRSSRILHFEDDPNELTSAIVFMANGQAVPMNIQSRVLNFPISLRRTTFPEEMEIVAVIVEAPAGIGSCHAGIRRSRSGQAQCALRIICMIVLYGKMTARGRFVQIHRPEFPTRSVNCELSYACNFPAQGSYAE